MDQAMGSAVTAQDTSGAGSPKHDGNASIRRAPTASSQQPPSVPTGEQKYWYLEGQQHRWLLVFQALAFCGVAYSIIRFSLSAYWTMLMLGPLALYTITLLISTPSSARKRRVTLVDHKATVELWDPATYPSVDVFLPSAGEDLQILENTYLHVSQLEWPGTVIVYVLDDSGRQAVQDLAHAYGFAYLSRPDRGYLKKAGNLRYGYDRSTGDLIAIFDADFVPRREYLLELVPYFESPAVGIVQSPQFFDTGKNLNWVQRTAGATQELFYRFVQPSRDRVNAAICVGTCGVYRRAALQKSGGFAQIGHSEDVHTGVNLLKVGFYVQYVPVILAKGLCPDDLGAFISQQYRWCTGSMSLLSDPAFHRAPLSRRQRMCFWSGFLYYISTGLNGFTAPLPAIAMVFFFQNQIFPRNMVPLLGVVVLWFMILPLTFRGRWRPEVLRIQTVYGFAHALSIVHMLKHSTVEWVPTGAANKVPFADTVKRVFIGYLGACQLLLFSGLVLVTWEYGLERSWAMILFAVFRAYIVLPLIWEARGVGFSRRRVWSPSWSVSRRAAEPVLAESS